MNYLFCVFIVCQPGFYGKKCDQACPADCYECDVKSGECRKPVTTAAPTVSTTELRINFNLPTFSVLNQIAYSTVLR